jgi:hypothetical protein
VDGPVLRLAGWNNRDPELSLLTLLEESELVSREICEALRQRSPFDYEVATALVAESGVPVETVRLGLREHARVVLSYLFQMRRGSFFFQRGQVCCQKELQFRLLITDVLLKTAAEMDEKTRTELASMP